MATVTLPGGPTVRYQEWGRPDGAVVLLLHGMGATGDSWRHLAPVLGRRLRCIAPDARGHGGSGWMPTYALADYVDDVVRFMDALGILAAIPFGHSFGAATAFQLAAQRPELVRMLVLEDMPSADPAKPPLPIPRQPDPDPDHDWRAEIALARWRNGPKPGFWEQASKVRATTLVLGGRRSHLPQRRQQELAEAIPDARYVALDLDHAMHESRPGAVLQVVEPFLAPLGK